MEQNNTPYRRLFILQQDKVTKELLSDPLYEPFKTWVRAELEQDTKLNKTLDQGDTLYFGISNEQAVVTTPYYSSSKTLLKEGDFPLHNIPDLRLKAQRVEGITQLSLVPHSKEILQALYKGETTVREQIGTFSQVEQARKPLQKQRKAPQGKLLELKKAPQKEFIEPIKGGASANDCSQHVFWEKETHKLLHTCKIALFQSWVTASVQTNQAVNKALKDTIVYYGIDNQKPFIVTKEQKYISTKGLNNLSEPDLRVRVEKQGEKSSIELTEESKRRLRALEQGRATKEEYIGYSRKLSACKKVPLQVEGPTLRLRGNIHYDQHARGEKEKAIIFTVYKKEPREVFSIGKLTIEYSGKKRSDMLPLITYEFNKPVHYQNHADEALITASSYLLNEREFPRVKLAVDRDKDPDNIPKNHLKLTPEKQGEALYILDKKKEKDLKRALHPSQGFNHKQYELVRALGKLEREKQQLTQELKHREHEH